MMFHASARRFRWWPLALLGLAASGCGNNPYPSGESAQSVLYASMADDPRTLDPGRSYRADEGPILDVICPSYYQYHYLKRLPFRLQLMLGSSEATREPYAFTDPETKKRVTTGELWTFHIRHDLRFQDDPCFPGGKGRPITGADFVYALRRAADPAVAAPSTSFLGSKIIGFDELAAKNTKLAKAKPPKSDYTTPVEGLKFDPKDPYTFRVALNQPYPQMRYIMAMHFTSPVPPEAVALYGPDLGHHPVGCGPYMLEEWTPKRRIVLAKNPNRPKEYYPKDGDPGDKAAGLLVHAGEQLPLTDKIVFTTITEPVTGWNLFLQGYMDSWGVSQTNYQQAVSKQGSLTPEMEKQGIRLSKADDVGVFYVVFNMEDKIIGGYSPKQRKLRQALSLTINSQESINLFSMGLGTQAQNVLPPGIFGYDPKYKNPYRQYDPKLTKAKQLLKEAGYPNGIDPKTKQRLTLYYDNGNATATGRQQVGLLTRQIEALGVNLVVRDWRDVVWQDKVDHGQFQMVSYGWLADYPDAENFMFLLYGPNKRPGPNASNYNNPAYNKLFEQMRSMDNGPQRLAIIKKMRTMLQEDCPLIWTSHGQSLGLSQRWLSAGKPMAVGGNTYKYRYIDGAERAKYQALWNHPKYWPILVIFALFIMGTIPAVSVVKSKRNRRITRAPQAPKA